MTERERLTTFDELKEQFYERIKWFMEYYPPLHTLIEERVVNLENPGIKKYDIVDTDDFNYIVRNVIDIIFNNYDFPNEIITHSVSEESVKFAENILSKLYLNEIDPRTNEFVAKYALLHELTKTDFGKIQVCLDRIIEKHYQFKTKISGVIEFAAQYVYEFKKSLTDEQINEFTTLCGDLSGLNTISAKNQIFVAYNKWIEDKQDLFMHIIRIALERCSNNISDETVKRELATYILNASSSFVDELISKYKVTELHDVYSKMFWSKLIEKIFNDKNVLTAVTLNTLVSKSRELSVNTAKVE